jgi:hypothetical protein
LLVEVVMEAVGGQKEQVPREGPEGEELPVFGSVAEGGREGGREDGREGGRERGRERGREGGMLGVRWL